MARQSMARLGEEGGGGDPAALLFHCRPPAAVDGGLPAVDRRHAVADRDVAHGLAAAVRHDDERVDGERLSR